MRENGWLVEAVSDVMRTVFICMAYLLVAGQWVFAAGIKEGDQFEIGGKRAVLSKVDSLPIVDNEFSKRFHWDSFDNPKLKELREIFSDFGLHVVDLSTLEIPKSATEENLEAFETFEENALAKARFFFEASGGIPTFGDDSGMCVDALDGEPGVYSKRWSGRDDLTGDALDAANNEKLVKRMQEAREQVFGACRKHGIAFLETGAPENIAKKLDEGVRVIAGHREETDRPHRPCPSEAHDAGVIIQQAPLLLRGARQFRRR